MTSRCRMVFILAGRRHAVFGSPGKSGLAVTGVGACIPGIDSVCTVSLKSFQTLASQSEVGAILSSCPRSYRAAIAGAAPLDRGAFPSVVTCEDSALHTYIGTGIEAAIFEVSIRRLLIPTGAPAMTDVCRIASASLALADGRTGIVTGARN
jgi:hypothetical protein